MLNFAIIGVFMFGVWLVVAFQFMLFNPQRCLGLLRQMGSTPLIHFGEHILRGLAGLSLMGIAAHTPHPKAFMIVGGFLLATSIIIGFAPIRWHHKYAVYWSEVIRPWMLRLMSILPLLVGGYLIVVAVGT